MANIETGMGGSTVESGRSRYPQTVSEFERFEAQMPARIAEARAAGRDTTGLEAEESDLARILNALEAGDTQPAKFKVADMIRRNAEFIVQGVPEAEVAGDETHAETIASLARLLDELEGRAPAYAAVPEKQQRLTREEVELGLEQVEAAKRTLERSMGDVQQAFARVQASLRMEKMHRLTEGEGVAA